VKDEAFIKRCFELASQGMGHTWPNPLVGSVIVKDGRIIGEGYHKKYGEDHAELSAIKNATESVEGATLYVNLEPCCHTNKQTPPCAQRLIQEKIKKVVIANLDPNPHVNGGGIELLRSQGIEVIHGILSSEGEKLNEVFFHAQRSKLPFVHLKMASTLDGRIAMPSGESQWITSESARAHVHKLRSTHQAVMVGANTVRKDNPKLNVRIPNFQGNSPYRIIFTKSGELPPSAQLLTDELKERTLIYTQTKIDLSFPSSQIIQISTLKEAMEDLFQKKIITLFLEGGANLASEFLREKLINRVSLYLNPSFLGVGPSTLTDFGLNSLGNRPRLKDIESCWLGEDFHLSGRIY
jgi:diaminohydroxyphosphoribosylaminopyrimidine deaminase/5-amino-6-(5-phosphoribosylamino)uracil reductase